MSYVTLKYIFCDGPLCSGVESALVEGAAYVAPGVGESAGSQRESLRREGWLVKQPGGKDYCPDCREKIKEPPTDG